MTDHSRIVVPEALAALRPLAWNLRWSWHRGAQELFRQIDPALWAATHHNPVRLLAEVSRARLQALSDDADFRATLAREAASLDAYLRAGDTWYAQAHGSAARTVAYFSAEFAVTECLRIYSGGLGVLAGDHLKSASDLGIPLTAVGLLYRDGYFTQQVDALGAQNDVYERADFDRLPLTPERTPDGEPLLVSFPFLDHRLHARVWRADVGRVALYLLDTDVPANRIEDRNITDRLYGGGVEHRLAQEMVLGIGGMRALAALGRTPDVVHLNEGHAAFAAVERARQIMMAEGAPFERAVRKAAESVVFTTHTPVAAGHDYFPRDLLQRYLGGYIWERKADWNSFVELGLFEGEPRFCMTAIALRLSSRRNGVSKLHGDVSREMWHQLWPDAPVAATPIGHITNGVHLPTWVSARMGRVFDRYIGADWRNEIDELHWHRANHIPLDELWEVRNQQRARLVRRVRQGLAAQVARRGGDPHWTHGALNAEALTVVFARRFATYKRATLLLQDEARLERLLNGPRPVQFVFAGKAHPRDEPGKELLKQIHAFADRSAHRARFVFLEGYDVELARALVHGADVWLNVPVRPYEASGTSGMKAAANGALNLSVPDGWWAEAWEEHNRLAEPIGWSVQAGSQPLEAELPDHDAAHGDPDRSQLDRLDALALYALLEEEVVPLFYDRTNGLPRRWCERIRANLRQVVPYFSTHRMLQDYVRHIYHGEPAADPGNRLAVGAGAG